MVAHLYRAAYARESGQVVRGKRETRAGREGNNGTEYLGPVVALRRETRRETFTIVTSITIISWAIAMTVQQSGRRPNLIIAFWPSPRLAVVAWRGKKTTLAGDASDLIFTCLLHGVPMLT